MHKIGVLIIDSESETLSNTRDVLLSYSQIESIEIANDSDEALLKLITINPDLVLLEYPPKGKAGKEIIRFIKSKREDTIMALVSESKKYAATAIRSGVFNYLVKPVSADELKALVTKVQQVKQTNLNLRVQEIIEKTQEKTRLRFQTIKGYILLDPEEILYCKSEGFYTEIYLVNGNMELSYIFISKLDEILNQFKFMRVSRSYIINLIYIRKLFSGRNIIVLSVNGKEIEIKCSKQNIRVLSKSESE